MNTPDITRVKSFTKIAVFATILTIAAPLAHAEWTVDFSRRSKAKREADLLSRQVMEDTSRAPASVTIQPEIADEKPAPEKGLFDTIFDAGEPVQDLVIMQTDRGFVPATVRVRKNGRYKIHVVNVNEKEKNVSFILEGFSEHHATYYGKIKVFTLEPKKEGTYSFQSPETSAEGKLIVFNPQINLRAPASADGSQR